MSDEKKIIIDEDWKSQVQAEKEDAARGKTAPDPMSEASSASNELPETGEQHGEDDHDPPMPPATFEMLLTTLATEALVAIGAMPHPLTGHQHAHPNQAKFLIDTIDVMKQKTVGNLTAQEAQLIESVLHQLRMVFVELTNRAPDSALG